MRSKSRFNDSSIYKIEVNTEGANRALNGNSGTMIFNDYRGIKVLSSFDVIKIQNLKWAVLAEIDIEEAEIPIVEFRNYVILLIAILSLATFIITFLISKRITDPIKKLTIAATDIGEGEYDKLPEINTRDEIELLSRAFNEMSKQLKIKESEIQLERNKRVQSAIDAQEKERERLSRELHDGLGQSFIALKLQLENTEPNNPDDTYLVINDVKLKIDNIIQEIRNMSNNLMS